MRILTISRRSAAVVAGVATTALAIVVAMLWGAAQDGSWDSPSYVDGARYLARGEGYVTSRGALGLPSGHLAPITLWPPGFSALMAPAIWMGRDPLVSAAYVQATSYVALVALLFLVGCRVGGVRLWPVITVFSVGLALLPSTLFTLDAVLSDLLFAAAVSLSLFVSLHLSRWRAPPLLWQIAAGAALGATFWVRYAGAGVVAGGVVGLVIARRGSPIVQRARALRPLLATVAGTMAPLVLRNWLLGGAPVGGRVMKVSSLTTHAKFAVAGVFQWIDDARSAAPRPYTATLLSVGVAFAIAGLAMVFVKTRAWRASSVRLIVATFGGYFATMILAATGSQFNELNEVRFWIPAWFLTAAFVIAVLGRARRPKTVILGAPAVLLGLGCVGLFIAADQAALPRAQELRELSVGGWKRAAALVPDSSECDLLSNDVRPMLLHQKLPPNNRLPGTLSDLDAIVRAHPKLCIAFVTTRLPRSTEGFRAGQETVVHALRRQGRLEELAHGSLLDVYRIVK